MTIACIIPTLYRKNLPLLRKSLAQLGKSAAITKGIKLQVFVFFNAHTVSKDDVRALRDSLPKSVRFDFLQNKKNLGYTGACNAGVNHVQRAWKPHWYLILNDDAFVHRNFFSSLLPLLKKKHCSAVSCKILKSDGSVESVGHRYFRTGLAFPRTRDLLPNEFTTFTGTCVFLSSETVRIMKNAYGHLFSPLFFAYAEDVELSLRILHTGGRICISNDGLVTHLGSRTAKRASFFQLYHGWRNLLLTVITTWPSSKILLNLLPLLLGQLYIVAFSFYKGYFFLYPKVLSFIWKRRSILFGMRSNHFRTSGRSLQ